MEKFAADFEQTFIASHRWQALLKGLGITLGLTFGALIIGAILGVLIAVVRSSHDQMSSQHKSNWLLDVANWICKVYLTVIRGTPMMVQLLIMYFVIMANSTNTMLVAILSFGINSGAYVAEIIRGGIMSVDKGQMEAGRSLGMTRFQATYKIIFPQALRHVLPAIGNEFIALLKETSVAGYVAIVDLTRAGNLVRNNTFDAVNTLMLVAITYLVLVVLLTELLKFFERRLGKSDANN